MGHMGNGVQRAMAHRGMGYRGYGAHEQWGTGAMGYRAIGYSGYGQWGTWVKRGTMDNGLQGYRVQGVWGTIPSEPNGPVPITHLPHCPCA